MPQLIGHSLALTKLASPGAGGGEGFSANAVTFDGTNDGLNRGAALDGSSNTKTMILSFWFRVNGSNGSPLTFLENSNNRLSVFRRNDDKIDFNFEGSGDNPWNFITAATFTTSNSEWVHILVSFDAAASAFHIFVNDASASIESSVTNDVEMDMSATDWFIGTFSVGPLVQPLDADLSEFYFTDEFLDISIEANRRKFIDPTGKPVDLRSDGSAPTGTAPLIFMTGSTDTWHTNKGSGGGFTETGALTDATNSPSD